MSNNPSTSLPNDSNTRAAGEVGPLQLRVIGTVRHGQTVQLAAQRVTIGSAPTCTLRLRSRGVRPLQCLIVRGPSGSTARSLSTDTLLNGQRFRDERLHVGDRLQVGSIELEVCDDGALALPAPSRVSERGATDKRPSSVVASEAAHWLRSETSRPQAILARIQSLEQRLEQLQAADPQTAAEGSAESPDSLNAANRESMVAGSEMIQSEAAHNELKNDPEKLIEQLNLANQRCEAVREELSRLAADRDALQTRCEELTRSQREAEDRLLCLQAEIGLRSVAENGYDTHESLLAAQAESEQRHAALTDEIQRLQQELTRRTQQQEELDGVRAELEASLSREHDLRATLENQLAAQASEVLELRTRCDALQSAALQRPEGSSHPSQEHVWLAQQFAASRPSEHSTPCEAESSAPLTSESDSISTQGEFTNASNADRLDGSIASMNRQELSLNPHPDHQSTLEVERLFVSENEQEAVAKQESDADDVFARLLRAGIWKEPVQESVAESELNSEVALNPLLQPDGSNTEINTAEVSNLSGTDASNLPAMESHREDDSIESYMQRLLQRVRGDSGPVDAPMFRQEEKPQMPIAIAPPSEAPDDAEIARPKAADLLTESEYQPRSHAPEMNSNLAAMRELANRSRHEQFLSHAHRTWTSRSQSLLIGSLAGLTITIASFLLLDIYSKLAAVGLVVGLCVTACGIIRVFQSRRHIFDELSLKPTELQPEQPIE